MSLARPFARVGLCLALLAAISCGSDPSDPSASGSFGSGSSGSPSSKGRPVAPADGPNVLLITVDTLRADHLSSYGHPTLKTPAMDGLAARGARFQRAYTTVPVTLPAHVSIMTGSYPPHHGVRSNGIFKARDSLTTLAEILQGRGYATSAVIGAVVLNAVYGLDQGFDRYDDAIQGGGSTQLNLIHAERTAEQVTQQVQQLIRGRAKGQSFFIWAHYFDPHTMYQPPQRFLEQYPESRYAGEVAYVDEQIGFLLDTLSTEGLTDDTLIVLTGDHGEGLGEHGEDIHGVLLHDSTLQVPLIVSLPGAGADDAPTGRTVDTTVSVVDILPTVLDGIGLSSDLPKDSVQGRSLIPLMEGADGDGFHKQIYFETLLPYFDYGWSALRGVRRNNLKLIDGPAPAFYDTAADPGENTNLHPKRPNEVYEMQFAMEELVERITVDADASAEIDEETRAELASLGYVSGAANTSIDEDPFQGPDPGERVHLVSAINKASFIYLQGNREEALAELQALMAEEPRNPTVLSLLGILNNDLGRIPAAVSAFEALVQVQPQREANWSNLGIAYRRQNRVSDAAEAFRSALDRNPNHVHSLYSLALISLEQRDSKKAEVGLERVVELDPRHAPARAWLGAIYAGRRDFQDAIAQLTQAVEIDPQMGIAHKNLASCYMSISDNEKAAFHVAEAQRLGVPISPAVLQKLKPYL